MCHVSSRSVSVGEQSFPLLGMQQQQAPADLTFQAALKRHAQAAFGGIF